MLGQTIGGLIADGVAGNRTDRLRSQLNGDQSQVDSALAQIDQKYARRAQELQSELAKAQARGDTLQVAQIGAQLDQLTDVGLRNRAVTAEAAVIKYGSADAAVAHTVVEVVGSNSSVIPLLDPSAAVAPLSLDQDTVVVTGQRFGAKLNGESPIGRVVVDTLDYAQAKVEQYGAFAQYAITGVKFLATGGIQPVLSLGINKGVAAAIPSLPDAVLEPIAHSAGAVKDFVGAGGGSILLGTDRASVSERDRSGVFWGAETLIGIGVAKIAAMAVTAIRSRSAYTHNYGYADRVTQRAMEDPMSHNFPYSYDDEILSGNAVPKPNGYTIYQKQGSMNGKTGVFEMGVTKDGVIDHRFFRPDQ